MQQPRRTRARIKKTSGIRRRDILVFIGCFVGVILSFQSEGSISFKEGFFVPWGEDLPTDAVSNLPKPKVTDVDGDGMPDLVAVTAPEKISIFSNFKSSRSVGGYIQELSPKTSAHLQAPIIAFSVGYLEYSEAWVKAHSHHFEAHKFNSSPKATPTPPAAPLKQFVVVLTDDYVVTLFDHGMTEIWAVRLPVPEPKDNFMYDEIDDAEELYSWFLPEKGLAMVLPYKIYSDDHGSIIIGVEIEIPLNVEEYDDDEMGAAPRHMAYFALSGSDGALRWAHNTTDEIEHSQEHKVKSQHSYKLTLQHLEHHAGEQDWRYFRRNVIASLPHSYSHHHDMRMQLHRFAPKKNRKKKTAATTAFAEVESFIKHKSKDRSKTHNNYGELGEKVWSLLQWRKKRDIMPWPNVIVVHRSQGLEALHLYTGKTLAQVGPLVENWLYEDVNDDAIIDGVAAHINDHETLDQYSRNWGSQKPSCKGIVWSGIPISMSPMYNHSICVEGGMLHNLEFLRTLLKNDYEGEGAIVNSLGGFEIPGYGSRDHFDETLTSVTPIAIHRISKGRTDVLFYISSGLVTCINGKTGHLMWHTDTDALFGAHAAGMPFHFGTHAREETAADAQFRENEESTGEYAHMKAFALRTPVEPDSQDDVVTIRNIYNAYPTDFVIVVGKRRAVVLNAGHGVTEFEMRLESPPVAPTQIVDFNSDGLNDLIFITEQGLRGYLGQSRKGATVITATLSCVMALLALLFLTHHSVQGPHRVKLARSTD